uniref:Putative secreted protein n=1 Tax=Anopheles marajoara TaxID=58244 RepID=A0A2M4CG88_9DIPT
MVPPVVMATAAAATTTAGNATRGPGSGQHCTPRSVASRRQDAAERNFLQRYYELHPLHHHRLELYATL